MTGLCVRALLTLTVATTMLVLTPGSAMAAAPTCTDVQVGVPHNASLPIFIPCSGGTGIGSPDVLVATNPSKGTLNPAAGGTSNSSSQFDGLDKNNDGKLDPSELQSLPSVQKNFTQYDTNHDGTLGKDEFAAALSASGSK